MATPCFISSNSTRLIICCDGTAKSEYLGIKESPLTNVSRISRCIAPRRATGDGRQLVLYLSGIGTSANSWLNTPANVWSQLVGAGLDEKIKEAYSFLCHNYDEQNGDEIILIGFSRGAFIVRCIADLIASAGLLTKKALYKLPDIYPPWKNGNRIQLPEELCRQPRIHVCAVWDTVASMGLPCPGFGRHHRPGSPNHVHSNLCNIIDNAFQALSLHEHRHPFMPIVWKGAPSCRLEQCWFLGYHSDIGGGKHEEALAHFALAWMLSKLWTFVDFDATSFWMPVPTTSSWRMGLSNLKVQDSMASFHRVLGSMYRQPRCQFWDHRRLEEKPPNGDHSNEKIHSTVRFLRDKIVFEEPESMRRRGYYFCSKITNYVWILRFTRSKQALMKLWCCKQQTEHIDRKCGLRFIGWQLVPHEYQVEEDQMSKKELEFLQTWVVNEHNELLNNSRMNQAPPGTILAQLEVCLGINA